MVPGTDGPPHQHPEVAVGRLANGLAVWTRHAPDPTGSLAVGLHVAVGSLCERDDERGLSHLIEHLAFRGGTHFPSGSLELFFDGLGTRVGRHHNAVTGLDRTCYTLTFPEPASDTLERAVACLADFAFGLELSARAVEQERRVVLEEMRGRVGARARIRERVLQLILPGSRIAGSHPLGTAEVVGAVTADALRAFHRRWYRPDTCTVVAAGEATADEVTAAVERWFGGWRREGPRPPAPAFGEATLARGACAVIDDPEADEWEASLVNVRRVPPARTRAHLVTRVVEESAVWLAGRRLGALVHDPSSRVRDVAISRSELACSWWLLEAAAVARSGGAVEAAAGLARELRRIVRFGFSDGELELARARLGRAARRLERPAEQRPTARLVEELLGAVGAGAPPPSAGLRHQILVRLADGLDRDALGGGVLAQLDPDEAAAVAVMPSAAEGRPTADDLRRALQPDAAEPPPAPTASRRVPELFDPPPAAADVRSRTRDQDLGVVSLRFDNGVRVHLRDMTAPSHRVTMQLTLTGGRIRETAAEHGLTAAAAVAFTSPAGPGISARAVSERLAETSVALECSVEEDCVTLRVTADPEDLEVALKLVHLLLTRARVEPAALRRWQAALEPYGADRPLGLSDQLAETFMKLLTSGDHRFRLLTHERALAVTVDRAEEWLDRELRRAPIEAAVVGAMDVEAACGLLQRYLGSLPARPERDPSLDPLRELEVPRRTARARVAAAGAVDRAALMIGWRAGPGQDSAFRQLHHMAAFILGQRLHLEVRQRRGLSYDVSCSYAPSRAYPAASLLAVTSFVEPERADEAAAAVSRLVEGIAPRGPDGREMEAARMVFADMAVRAERSPRFWARVLSQLDTRGGSLAELQDLPGRCRRRTADELCRAIADTLQPDRRVEVVCVPP